MAKKQVQKPVSQPAMTKKQLSRWQKEKRQERLALAFVVGVVALLVLVLGFGYFQENVATPNAAFAKVNGVSLPANAWVKAMALQSRYLQQQSTYWDTQLAQLGTSTDEVSAYYRYLIEEQKSQVTSAQQNLLMSVPENLMEAEVVRQESEKRGLTVSEAEIQDALKAYFMPTADEPITDTESTTPTPTPIPADAWQTNLKDFLTTLKVTESEYRELALLPALRRDKLQVALSATVATSGEQIRVSQIATDTYEGTVTILGRLQAGEDFAAVAKELSSDPATAEIGGDLGWYPRTLLADEFGQSFEDAAWALQVGAVVTTPVVGSYEFYILKQTDRSADRPYDADKLSLLQGKALQTWLTAQMDSPAVERFLDSEKQMWVQAQVTKYLSGK